MGKYGATGTINVARPCGPSATVVRHLQLLDAGSTTKSVSEPALTPAEVRCIYRSSVDVTAIGLQTVLNQFDQGIAAVTTPADHADRRHGEHQRNAVQLRAQRRALQLGGRRRYTHSVVGDLVSGGTSIPSVRRPRRAGVYTETFAGTSGCDSTVALTLSWAIDTSLQQSGPMLTANQAGVAYTWGIARTVTPRFRARSRNRSSPLPTASTP